jgi:serine protease Do
MIARRSLLLFVSLISLLPATVAHAQEDSARAAAVLMETQKAFVSIAKNVTPAVVNINTTKIIRGRRMPLFEDPFFQDFFSDSNPFGNFFKQPDYKSQSLGSGVIVSPDGYVVTNNHVVEGADEIKVSLSDKREFTAKLIGTDPDTDIALLKIKGTNLPVARWGNSDILDVGEWVVAIGNPFGLSQTVTAGIVSAKGRTDVGISAFEDFIQTDAAINPGNSGGALVNIKGELIGINTAIFSQSGGYQGIGFAIPSKMAQGVMKSLMADGKVKRGWLGVLAKPVTEKIAQALKMHTARGVLVQQLYQESPADQAGLEPGDVLLAFGSSEIKDLAQLRKQVAALKVGQKASLTVFRDGASRQVSVTIQEHPTDNTGRLVAGI